MINIYPYQELACYFPPATRELALNEPDDLDSPIQLAALLQRSLTQELCVLPGIGIVKVNQLLFVNEAMGARYFAFLQSAREHKLWFYSSVGLYSAWKTAVYKIEDDPEYLLALNSPFNQRQRSRRGHPQIKLFHRQDIVTLRAWLASWKTWSIS